MKKEKWSNYSLIALDTETTAHREFTDEEILAENRASFALNDNPVDFTPNDTSRVFLCGMESIKTKKYLLSYENIPDIFDNIVKITFSQERHWKALVFIHNLSYDFSYILVWLIQNHYKQSLKTDKFGNAVVGRKEFSILKSGGKMFSATMFWKGVKITFIDSLKLLPASLDSLSKEMLKIQKMTGSVDYSEFKIMKNHKYPQIWLDYLKRDVDCLAGIIEEFIKEEPHFTLKRATIGGIAASYVEKIVSTKIPEFTIADYNKFEPWYCGGLCFPSFNYWGKWVYKPDKIKMLDICSSYPTAMTKQLPFGKSFKEPQKEWKSYCAFYKVAITYACIKEQYNDVAILPKPSVWSETKHQRVYMFSEYNNNYQYIQLLDKDMFYFLDSDGNKNFQKTFIYYLTDKELDLIKKLYDLEYNIIDVDYFETDNYLESDIRLLFKAKQEASRNNQPTKKLLAKLKINNIYGKFGQKWNRTQDFYGKKEDIDTDLYEIVGSKNELYESYNIRRKRNETEKAHPIFLAAYITSLARVKLIERYIEITKAGNEFLYCDTDSIAYIENNKQEFTDIGDELGNWEYEKLGGTKVADAFCSLCSKQYRIVKNKEVVKTACAGVKKDVMKTVKNQDYNYSLGENKNYNIYKTQLKNSVYGKVIWNSQFSFKKWKEIMDDPVCPKQLQN